jgi:sugar phosphate isomerase/epimerase
MVQALTDTRRLCIHTITTKPWSLDRAAEKYAKAGIRHITVWRDALEACGAKRAQQVLRDSGLSVTSLCRGGFFPADTKKGREAALADNRRAIEEAHAIGAPLIVLVCGAVPGLPLAEARAQIIDGICALLPECEAAGVKLAIEPLHPMYADSRSAINTLKQANDAVERIASPLVGVAVDVYHLWWDPDLGTEIARCGRMNALFAYHICDWRTPTRHLLTDRALMGDGCINLRQIRSWVEETGFAGPIEVEIFSEEWWATDQDAFLAKIIAAYKGFA